MSRSSGKIMRPLCSLVDFILFDAFCLWCFQMFIVFTYINFFFSHNSFIQGYGMTNCTPMSGRAHGNGLMARGGANASFKVAGSTGALAMLRKREFMHVGNMYAC